MDRIVNLILLPAAKLTLQHYSPLLDVKGANLRLWHTLATCDPNLSHTLCVGVHGVRRRLWRETRNITQDGKYCFPVQ
jgi:hypothetical protein